MLLTITTTHQPADELGFLLAKNPARAQTFDLAFGRAHVFYPDVGAERCTAALLLDIDPVGLSRRPGRDGDGAARTIEPYVNDRAYVASSFLSVAIAQVFRSALNGACKERPALVDEALPLIATLHVVPCVGGERFLRALFEPLGYEVEATRVPLDAAFPSWGDSGYFSVTLRHRVQLQLLLSHLYVLMPVLDDEKHYWVSEDEIEKLLRHGEGWLKDHPERQQIAHRYLRRQRSLTNEAMRQLLASEEPEVAAHEDNAGQAEDAVEKKLSLNEQRLQTVVATLKGEGATRVLDLGCGEGKLLRHLVKDKTFTRVVGTDVAPRALEVAAARLRMDEMTPRQRARIELFQSSITYRDARFAGFDALCAVEVVEHLDASRLPAFERAVFEHARCPVVIVTTPNAEYNVRFEGLAPGAFRHRDHRFEWTRGEFHAWADGVAQRHFYDVRIEPIGEVDEALGAPTQMAVFTRADVSRADGSRADVGGDA